MHQVQARKQQRESTESAHAQKARFCLQVRMQLLRQVLQNLVGQAAARENHGLRQGPAQKYNLHVQQVQ